MALQLSYEAQTGVTHASAYWRILTLVHDRLRSRVTINVAIYADAQARIDDKIPVGGDNQIIEDTDYTTYFDDEVLDLEDQNPTERAYTYLKTLAAYDGASNV